MTNTQTSENKTVFGLFKQALRGNTEQDFTQGSIGQAAFLLSVPMVLEMVMESIFAVTDIFFVSSLGSEAVSVVGLTEAVLTLLYAIAIGLSMAVTATVARRIGEKDVDGASKVAAQTLWVGAITALIIGVFGVHYAIDILKLMGANSTVAEQGESYTSIMMGGSITILYLFLINAIFRGAGDASVAMKSLWLASGINIVLDPMLIFGIGPFPEMGLAGAAVATNIGRGIGIAFQLYVLFSMKSRIKLAFHQLALHWEIVTSLLKTSIGGVLQFLIATASWVALVRIVSEYGSDAVAGYTIAIRVVMFSILPAWGLSNAAATLVGQNLGAQLPARAEKSVWTIAKYNVAFMLLVAFVFYAFAPSIIGLFINDPVVESYGINCLRYVSYGYGFYALGMVLVQSFNGAGDTMTPTAINFVCYWIFQIPLAYGLASFYELGPDGVFLAIAIAESIIALVAFAVFRRGSWKLKTV
ncbi:MATE family efflux transporter [Alteromonadaceae bacterium M269]|nr:MATE family efflux transporter [Alteromonadaceae bacterium M269]